MQPALVINLPPWQKTTPFFCVRTGLATTPHLPPYLIQENSIMEQ